MKRGVVVPLTTEQIVKRALYLAGKATVDDLDEWVRKDNAPRECPAIYYLLTDHNGGKDPTAPDPADRWSNPGSSFVNITCDCSGGNSWMHGFDRYQPNRMRKSIGYGGWFNTDSKIRDVRMSLPPSEKRCFKVAGGDYFERGRPEPGAILTCESGSPGHRIGHEGCVVAYHGAEWDPKSRDCWALIDVVDVSAQGAGRRANLLRTGIGWYGTGAWFLHSVMEP
jgi:hypothetical protein